MPEIDSPPRPPLLQRRFRWGSPGGYLGAWCPACASVHYAPTVPTRNLAGELTVAPWTLVIDDAGRPTLSPSLLIRGPRPVCHATLTAGVWQYHADSGHALAGQVVDVPPIPGTD